MAGDNGGNRISTARFFQYVLERQRQGFYGTLHVQFRAGTITLVKPEQTFTDDESLPIEDEGAVRLMQTGRFNGPVT